jgi:glyoxylase-like metal-dependent hydrolase (beta-lactamase superfamily II)
MSATRLREHIYLIDVEVGGFKNLIASYVLKGDKTIIVESGPTSSVPNLLSALKHSDIRLENVAYLAVSHVHLDHGGGAGTLIKSLPNAKVVVHPKGAPHLIDPQKLWQQSKEVLGRVAELYGEPEPVPEDRIIAATDGMTLSAGNNIELKVVETPGHASHHQSYYETLGHGVFPGDAAGIYIKEIEALMPTTPPPFHVDTALTSLNRLIDLKPKNLYYSHFGEASNAVGRLHTYVSQIRLWVKIALEAIQNREGLETVRERIIESDESMRKTVEFLRHHPVLKETILNNSVRGIVDYVRKMGPLPCSLV